MRVGQELLTQFAAIEARRPQPGINPWTPGPWRALWAGGEWVMATDGHVLTAVRASALPPVEAPAPESVLKLLARIAVPESGVVVPASELRALTRADAPPCDNCHGRWQVMCSECDGKGGGECECHCGHIHDSTCEVCDDELTVECECRQPRNVKVLGARFNATKIGDAVRAVLPEPKTFVRLAMDPYGCLTVTEAAPEPRWFFLVMKKLDGPYAEEWPPADAPWVQHALVGED